MTPTLVKPKHGWFWSSHVEGGAAEHLAFSGIDLKSNNGDKVRRYSRGNNTVSHWMERSSLDPQGMLLRRLSSRCYDTL